MKCHLLPQASCQLEMLEQYLLCMVLSFGTKILSVSPFNHFSDRFEDQIQECWKL